MQLLRAALQTITQLRPHVRSLDVGHGLQHRKHAPCRQHDTCPWRICADEAALYPQQPADKASAEACTAGEALDWLRWGAARDPIGCDSGVSKASCCGLSLSHTVVARCNVTAIAAAVSAAETRHFFGACEAASCLRTWRGTARCICEIGLRMLCACRVSSCQSNDPHELCKTVFSMTVFLLPQLSTAKADAVRRLVFSLQRSQASKKRPGRTAGESRQPAREAEEPAGEEVNQLMSQPQRSLATILANFTTQSQCCNLDLPLSAHIQPCPHAVHDIPALLTGLICLR